MTEGGGGGKITAIERDSLIGYRLFFPDNSILISHLSATEGGERWVGEGGGGGRRREECCSPLLFRSDAIFRVPQVLEVVDKLALSLSGLFQTLFILFFLFR